MKPTGLFLAESVFWICLVLIAYSYFLYPLFLFLVYSFSQIRRDFRYLVGRRDRRVRVRREEDLPSVSLVVPAYNEEHSISKKIANFRELRYPTEKLELVIVSDGSTDRTNEILRAVQGGKVKAMVLPVREGKFNALNCGVANSENDILVFSDATTLFARDAIENLVRHFVDPGIGAVCGTVQLVGNSESQQTENLYWKYESMLHLMEARLGATVTASGAIYALPRHCYRPLEPGDIIDDFLVPMRTRKQGYRVLYDPEAVATDFSADSVKGEFTRRVRLAVGSFRALSLLFDLRLRGFVGLAFFSHKLLRWISPFLLIALLVSNGFLLRRPVFRIFFFAQLAFYLWAALGFLFRERVQRVRYALVGYFLVAMHVAFLVGFWRYLLGHGESTWQRVN